MRFRIQRRSDMCSLGVGLSRRSIQVLTEPNITVVPPNLEVIMSYIILFDRQFVPLSGPNSRRTRTEHVQNEGCFFGEKGTCNCNAKTRPGFRVRERAIGIVETLLHSPGTTARMSAVVLSSFMSVVLG